MAGMNQTLSNEQLMRPVLINRYLTKQEVSRYLRISVATLNRRIREGKFPPAEKIGKITLGWLPETLKAK
ncbi:helix-turn-helix transcriptional regulator [Rosenbergiella metrosideri]|uniref:helix-turn-helix transcriptional regulator n=1 Tax=Rosenbergiella metrosideri TaxID=2921185 RepID=UPI001F4FB80F|nr:helix-turn-helix domain-containing protein [Rosenbergiella metrosideri]